MDDDAQIVEEFQFLKEKSFQLFDGLRDLPEYGQHFWRPYFQKTFEVYTKLWRFQQDHRQVLENTQRYGMKRWEIGEIASKIGQLYYHFYLRTSETNYLYEAFVFYKAIHERGYFKSLEEASGVAPVVKQLRFYARYVVVSLLLNKRRVAEELLEILSGLVEEYTQTYSESVGEWRFVVRELQVFLAAEQPVAVTTSADGVFGSEARRRTSRVRSEVENGVVLKQAVLVTNRAEQTKFSQLTIDLFRFLQLLEVQPSASVGETKVEVVEEELEDEASGVSGGEEAEEDDDGGEGSSGGGGEGEKGAQGQQREVPVKHMLYRPSATSVLEHLGNAQEELEEGEALLVYLCVAGGKESSEGEEVVSLGEEGGVQGLTWGDVCTFTRKATLLVVESEEAGAFVGKGGARFTGVPFVCVCSPGGPGWKCGESGSVFTLFLQSPLLGLCALCGVEEMSGKVMRECEGMLEEASREVEEALVSLCGTGGLEESVEPFMADGYASRLLARFVMVQVVCGMQGVAAGVCVPDMGGVVEQERERVEEVVGKAMGLLGGRWVVGEES